MIHTLKKKTQGEEVHKETIGLVWVMTSSAIRNGKTFIGRTDIIILVGSICIYVRISEASTLKQTNTGTVHY